MESETSIKCREVGLIDLHNHLTFIREKKKAQELFIFDIGVTSQLELGSDVEDIQDILQGENLDASFKTRKTSEVTAGDGTVSENDSDNRLGLFKCAPLDLYKTTNSKQAIMTMKR